MSTAYAYLYNLQGDVIDLVDSNGAKVVSYTYDAWGKRLSKTGTLASTLGTVQPFRYRAYVYDEETGLYYLRSRFYSSHLSRFLNMDSELGESHDLFYHNAFLYCSNNPVLWLDENGMGWFLAAASLFGAVAGAVTQIATNVAMGVPLLDNVIGAAVGGAVYNAVGLLTHGNTAAAAYASAAAESFTNEVISYVTGDKELSWENIGNSVATVTTDTAVNGTIYYVTGKSAERVVKTNSGWFQPKKFVSSFTGKYARKVAAQTFVQAGANFAFVNTKNITMAMLN